MIFKSANGAHISSRSYLATGADGTTYATSLFPDLACAPFADEYWRLGGALAIGVGVGVSIDTAEVKRNDTAATATAKPVTEAYGHQVVAGTPATAYNSSINLFRGVYTGILFNGSGQRGYNMPSTTATVAVASVAPTNGFTFLGATTTRAADPNIGFGGDYALCGEIIVVRCLGPAIAWVHDDDVATAAYDSVSFHSTAGATAATGTFTKAAVPLTGGQSPRLVVIDNPTTYAAAGTAMGCRCYLNGI